MKGIFLVLFILFFNSSFAVETCDYSTQDDAAYVEDDLLYDGSINSEPQSFEEEELWMINLSKHLVQMDDVNIKFLALSSLNMSFFERVDTDVDSELPVFNLEFKLSVLNEIIESPFTTVSTLLAASSMCIDHKDQCDVDRFNQKLFDLAPENLNVYFNELEQAVKDTDQELIDIILEQMSGAKHSQHMISFSDQFIAAIDFYISENPIEISSFGDSHLKSLEADVEMEVVLKQDAMISFLANNYMYFPALNTLMVACEQWQNEGENCQAIANTLIDKSDASLMIMIGHSLAVKMNELFGDTKSLANSQKQKEEYNEYQSCLFKNHTLLDDSAYMLDENLLQMMIGSKNELEGFEKTSIYIYNLLKESDIEGAINPKECGLRYVGVNE